MSLINDALKKAQKERAQQQAGDRRSLLQEASATTARSGSTHPHTRSAAPSLPWFKLLFGLIIAGSTLASAIAFMIFLFVQVQSGDSGPVPPSANPPREPAGVTIVMTPQGNSSSPISEKDNLEINPVLLSKDSLAANLDSAPNLSTRKVPGTGEKPVSEAPAEASAPPPPSDPDSPSPEPPAIPTTPQNPAAEMPPAVNPPIDPALVGSPKAPVPASFSTPSPQPSTEDRQQIEDYIRNANVTGVRLSGPDSKVVLNNRVYRLKEQVLDLDLHLMIVGIQKSLITFEDEYGSRYTKRF